MCNKYILYALFLKKQFRKFTFITMCIRTNRKGTLKIIDRLIRPLVRCGKCGLRYKPLDDDVRNEIYCTFIGSTMRKDDFCSYGCADGERKEE